MRGRQVHIIAINVGALSILMGVTVLAQQDRYTLKVPDGLAFSEFKGYDTWQDVAVSETESSVKAILGNPTTIRADKEGIPNHDKPFPDGSQLVKIEWIKKKNPVSPYFCGGAGHPKIGLIYGKGFDKIPRHTRMGIRQV